MPGGLLITIPAPLPAFTTCKVAPVIGGVVVKITVQLFDPFMVTVLSLQSESPDQLLKYQPPKGLASRVTFVSGG
ncbi:MAG: hypothetical protein EXR50_02155 [Dehalococcoidia bacterium]|nr:hypothetical protein [Dehalococcoidia bacterium]